MRIVGIIAEYNPFHNGHAYQIKSLRRLTGADYCIVAMSGNFVQRGMPAIMDKYTRTKMALSCGADLVIELPVLWATSSAEFFASGAVELLKQTQIIDMIGFGTEADTNQLSQLQQLADLLSDEPDNYRMYLQDELRQGFSFPLARKHALLQTLREDSPDYDWEQTVELLSSPNNILAVEYLKAMKDSSIQPMAVPRVGDAYHATRASSQYASATTIRELLQKHTTNRFSTSNLNFEESLLTYIPPECHKIMLDYLENRALITDDSYSSLLGYRLYTDLEQGFDTYADCSPELSSRICHRLVDYRGYAQFADSLKTKDITRTRINRALLHILLNITKADYAAIDPDRRIPYLRILGFRSSSKALLRMIKEESECPMITKVADAESILDDYAMQMLDKDLYAGNLYAQQLQIFSHRELPNEYTHPIVVL